MGVACNSSQEKFRWSQPVLPHSAPQQRHSLRHVWGCSLAGMRSLDFKLVCGSSKKTSIGYTFQHMCSMCVMQILTHQAGCSEHHDKDDWCSAVEIQTKLHTQHKQHAGIAMQKHVSVTGDISWCDQKLFLFIEGWTVLFETHNLLSHKSLSAVLFSPCTMQTVCRQHHDMWVCRPWCYML